ncbi:MAG: fibrobacter succinogenes major paralogous domain-containing protein [Bacteroidales bacterium]
MKRKNTLWICLAALTALASLLTSGCDKDDDYGPVSTMQAAMDIDSNVYFTVKIGRQVWMVENLRTTRYNDGTPIPYLPGTFSGSYQTSPGYSWYDNDATKYKNLYGCLYNWYAINTGKLAPVGWHIPSDAEWDTLTTFLGGPFFAGGYLKEKGLVHWLTPNTGANNSTGFIALPGGGLFDNYFRELSTSGFWGTTSESDTTYWCRYILFNNSALYRNRFDKGCGFSVRCIKD